MLRLIFVAGLALSCFANADVIRLSNPVAQTEHSETFGEVFDTSANPVSLGDVMSDTEEFSEKSFLLKTEIAKVCQKKGCFFIAREAGHAVRVSFKDYGFFIPTDASGKTVMLQGELIAKALTEKQASHFNQDLGDGTQLKKGPTFEIVASGIQIPKS